MMRRGLLPLLLILVSSLALRCSRNGEVARSDEPLTGPGAGVERDPYFVDMTDTTAVIRWRTYGSTAPSLRYWTEEADTVTVALDEEEQDHTVEMRGLAPLTTYTYQISLGDTTWSRAAEFRTFPSPGAKDPFTFLSFGDSGTRNEGQLALAEHLNEEDALLAIHMGDLAYMDGTPLEYTRNHFDVYAPFLKRAPLFPSPGDHDWRTDLGQVYADIFTPPGGRASGSPFYYAFTVGNVRFLSLDSKDDEEHARAYGYLGNPSSDQYQWLLRQLSAARADPGIDWIVAYFHHPPYSASTGFGGHGSHLPTRRALSPLMDGYRVPLVFNGHDHDYQRSEPIRGNRIVEDGEGTVYVVTGGAGARFGFRGTGADWFTAYADQVVHYVRVTVDHYDLTMEAVDENGRVFDSYEMSIPEDRRKPWTPPADTLAAPDSLAAAAAAAGADSLVPAGDGGPASEP